MAVSNSENLGLKIQDDEEFLSIEPTAENFEKIDAAYGEMLADIAAKAADTTEKFQGVNTALAGKSDKTHAHTADEISETDDKKVLTVAERTKLAEIASKATRNVVDSALNANSTNAVENAVIVAALAEKSNKTHTHTAAEISETSEKKVLTAAERTKLAGIAAGATKNIVDTALDKNSTNAICNKVVTETLGEQLTSILGVSLYASRLASHVSEQGAFGTDGDGSSGKMYLGELLLQWGSVTHKNAAAKTVEEIDVNFESGYNYKNAKYIVLTQAMTATPQNVATACYNRKATGFVIEHYRADTKASAIGWLTIGRGAKNATEEALDA